MFGRPVAGNLTVGGNPLGSTACAVGFGTHPSLVLEHLGEVLRVLKSKLICDLTDRLIGTQQLAFRLVDMKK